MVAEIWALVISPFVDQWCYFFLQKRTIIQTENDADDARFKKCSTRMCIKH